MKAILNNKKVLICFIIVIIILFAVGLFLFLNKDEETSLTANKVKVKYGVAEELYNSLEKRDLGSDKEYVSKLYGYTYDENENVEITVKEGYTLNNKVYDLDGKEIGNYSEDTFKATMDKATSKKYSYSKTNDGYKLNN